MTFLVGVFLSFLIYWLIVFVGCYLVVEYGQSYLYDETTPGAGLKVAIGSFLLAVLLTTAMALGAQASYDTMFTQHIGWTLLHGVFWFGVFTLVFRFHPPHALAIGLVALVILAGGATLAINSMTGRDVASAAPRAPAKPLRRTLGPSLPSNKDKMTESKQTTGSKAAPAPK